MSKKVFENTRQVYLFVTQDLGRVVSENTVRAHIKQGRIVKRRGGGFTERTVRAYAETTWPLKIDANPAKDWSASGGQGASEERTKADAELKKIQAERAKFNYDRDKGKYTETATVERELGERAKAFRIGLEKWGHDQAVLVAAMFGGRKDTAEALCAVLGVGEEKIPAVIEWAEAQADVFRQRWNSEVEAFLDSYATGAWWTEEMRTAWDRYEENHAGSDS